MNLKSRSYVSQKHWAQTHGFNLGPFFIQKQRLIIPQILLFTWPWEKDHNTRLGCQLDSRPSKAIHPHIPASQDMWLKCVPLGHKTAQNTVSETCHLLVRGADLKCQPCKSKLLFPYISKAYRCLRGTQHLIVADQALHNWPLRPWLSGWASDALTHHSPPSFLSVPQAVCVL